MPMICFSHSRYFQYNDNSLEHQGSTLEGMYAACIGLVFIFYINNLYNMTVVTLQINHW